MNKTHASLGCLGLNIEREAFQVVAQGKQGIDHDSFCSARMCVFTLERNGGGARAPGLIADLAECFTINGVGYLGAESLYVKFIYAASDFLIRRESDRQRAVFDLRILTQCVNHGHDLCNSRFVVRSEKRRAVG